MFFDLSDEQLALREMASSLFADLAPLSRLRQLAESDDPPDGVVWSALAEGGLLGLGVSEDRGGSGGDEVDAAVVLEAAGHACVPEPVVGTLGVVGPALGRVDGVEDLVADMVAGRRTVAVAVADHDHVDAGRDADTLLVEVDDAVHLVDAVNAQLEPVATWDPARRVARVVDVAVSDANRLDVDAPALRTRWWAATAMSLVGTAQRMLDLAVEHARVREQFGSPIGSYQAVAHPLAAVHVELEAARAGTWHAALAHRDDPASAAEATRVAVVAAHEAALLADRTSLQVLGGIGFTWEHDLHLALKHGVASRARLGDVAAHRRQVAADLAAKR